MDAMKVCVPDDWIAMPLKPADGCIWAELIDVA